MSKFLKINIIFLILKLHIFIIKWQHVFRCKMSKLQVNYSKTMNWKCQNCMLTVKITLTLHIEFLIKLILDCMARWLCRHIKNKTAVIWSIFWVTNRMYIEIFFGNYLKINNKILHSRWGRTCFKTFWTEIKNSISVTFEVL